MSADVASDVPRDEAGRAAPGAAEAARPLPGRRMRRKAETRQRLLDAATTLFAERGFEGTRPQDIARAADVAVGTFYVHFEDRRDAFRAFTARAADELMGLARERASEGDTFEERLAVYLDTLLDYADRKPGVLRAAFADEAVISKTADGPAKGAAEGETLRDRLARGLARRLEAGMERGVFRADYDPLLVSYGMVGLIQQALVHGARHATDRAKVIGDITRFCGRALNAHPRGAAPASQEDSP